MPKNIIKKEPKKTGEWFNPMKTLLIEKDVAETSITPFEKTTDPVSDLTVLPALEPSSEFTSRIRFDEITKAMEMTFSDVGQEHDANFNNLTIRDFYAIVQKKPVSNKHWLNTLITSKHE